MRYEEIDENIKGILDNVKRGQKFYKVRNRDGRWIYPRTVDLKKGRPRLFVFQGGFTDDAFEDYESVAVVIAGNLPEALTFLKTDSNDWLGGIGEIKELPLKKGLADVYNSPEIA